MFGNIKFVLIMCVTFIFLIFSKNIDQFLAIASYSHSSKIFYGERAIWCDIVYYAVPFITVVLICMPLIYMFKQRHNNQKRYGVIRFGLIVYLSLVLGPALMVNVLFKDNWGRARPYQVLRDGANYSPFWQPHFSQKKYNSFPSGHASIGFFLGIPFLALGRKKTAITISLFGGVIVGSVRMLQGGHYFSDVIFSAIFVWLVSLLVIYFVSKLYLKDNN